jgi:PAS domain S-box-containing protein
MTPERQPRPVEPPAAEAEPELALLDRDGVIVWVNEAWTSFGALNDADPARTGVGASYLAACRSEDDAVARLVARAIGLAASGRLPVPFRVVAPCHTDRDRFWFEQLVASRYDDAGRCVGATVTHSRVAPELGPSGAVDEAGPEPAEVGPSTGWGAATPRVAPAGLPVLDPTAAWVLMEMSPDGQLLLDGQGRIAFVNLTMEMLSGYTREELVGASVDTLVPLPMRSRHVGLRSGYLEQPQRRVMGTSIPARMRRRDGTEIGVDVSLAPMRVGDQQMIGCSVRDVDESRERERRLRVTETFFGVSFDRSPIGMAVLELDPTGSSRLVRVNAVLADMLGETAEALVGRDVSGLGDPAEEPLHRLAAAAWAEGTWAQPDRPERFVRADGTSGWASVFVSRVDTSELPRATALVHVVDMTRHMAVEQLQRRQAALTRLLVSATNDMLAGVPQDEVVTRIVVAAARVFDAESAAHFTDAGDGRYVRPGPAWQRAGAPTDSDVTLDADVLARLVHEPGVAAGTSAFARYGRPGLPSGVLALSRPTGADRFTEPEVELLTSLAYQLGLTMELFMSRADQERLRMIEDRQRLARDLHDSVVQDLIGVGMQLNNGLGPVDEVGHRLWELELVDQIESAVDRLRSMVVHLRRPDSGPTLSGRLREIVARVTPLLAHAPELVVVGDLDAMPRIVADQVAHAVREALSNVARHAGASSTRVEVAVDEREVRVRVEDDGVGIPDVVPSGHGLDNLRQRAESLDGDFSLRRRPSGGTSLVWSASIVSPAETMKRYRLDAASSSDVVLEAGADGVITWVSPAVTGLLGWSPEAFIGKRGRDLVHPDEAAAVDAAGIWVGTGNVARSTRRMRCADGSYRWVRSVVRPVLDERGAVLYRIIGVSAVWDAEEYAQPVDDG